MFYVYVLRSFKYLKSYVGITENVQKRLREHNSGKSSYTSRFKPWEIIYKEEYLTKDEALHREKYFKTHAGRKKLKEIFEHCGIV